MSKMVTIAKAWYRVFTSKLSQEERNRANICKDCTSAVYKRFIDFIDDELTEVQGMVCGECNCPLIAKVRSEDKCPLGKW